MPSFYMGNCDRDQWLRELAVAELHPRVLTQEESPARLPSDREQCIICDKRTKTWLQPENAPVCSPDCLDVYVGDPSIYDPRSLHSEPGPDNEVLLGSVMEKPKKKSRRRKKPGRWEPSEEYIAAAQARIRAECEARKKGADLEGESDYLPGED